MRSRLLRFTTARLWPHPALSHFRKAVIRTASIGRSCRSASVQRKGLNSVTGIVGEDQVVLALKKDAR